MGACGIRSSLRRWSRRSPSRQARRQFSSVACGMATEAARADTGAIRRILASLVDQQRRLRSTGAPDAEVEANRRAIAYWHGARTRSRAARRDHDHDR